MPRTPLTPYVKPPLAPAQLIAKLKGQGLIVADEIQATKILERVSYFRFRGYLFPYLDLAAVPPGQPRQFRHGARFEQVLEMYRFDDGLRKLVFNIVPEIEVAVRTALGSTMSHVANHGFWYLQPKWFKSEKPPERVINSLGASFSASSERYANHYHDKYYNDHSGKYKHFPPFWVISELSTLGQIKEIVGVLNENAPNFPPATLPKNTVLDKMARRFGSAHYREFANWINVLRDVRNVCAHHGRLWNRNLLAPTGVVKKVTKPFPSPPSSASPKTNTIYAALVVMRVMCKAQSIPDGIKPRLQALFTDYPEALNHLDAIGMPPDWANDTVWA